MKVNIIETRHFKERGFKFHKEERYWYHDDLLYYQFSSDNESTINWKVTESFSKGKKKKIGSVEQLDEVIILIKNNNFNL